MVTIPRLLILPPLAYLAIFFLYPLLAILMPGAWTEAA